MQRSRRAQAFTLIEVLVVIGIIAILVTLVTMGVRSVTASAKEKSTRVTMQSLKNLIAERQVSGGSVQQLDSVFAAFYPPNTNPPYAIVAPFKMAKSYGEKAGSGTDRYPIWDTTTPPVPQNCVAATQSVIALLKAVPNNAKWITGLPTNASWTPKSPQEVTGPPASTIPIFLDAWGNPIIYVPSGGLTGVVVSGGTASGEDVRVTAITSRDQRGFWASAGADGYFTDPDPSTPLKDRKPFGDDNIYSFGD